MLSGILFTLLFWSIFVLGVYLGKMIEHQRWYMEDEEIEEDKVDEPKPLVSYKERRKVYKQLNWHIDD